jgi:hypothetical protein
LLDGQEHPLNWARLIEDLVMLDRPMKGAPPMHRIMPGHEKASAQLSDQDASPTLTHQKVTDCGQSNGIGRMRSGYACGVP